MCGDNIIKEYRLFESYDSSCYKKFDGYIRHYTTAENY